MDAPLSLAERRHAERQQGWRSQAPLGEKVAGRLGPDLDDARKLFEDLRPVMSADPAGALRLIDVHFGRHLTPAALAAGLAPDEVDAIVAHRGGRR